MSQINIRMEDDLKVRAEALFEELGMNMSTAFTVFVKQALRQNGIPFEITADPFYSEANQAHLRKVIASLESGGVGKPISRTMEELEAMANE
jgi:addiction module antitoxin, RelB/DinJ family